MKLIGTVCITNPGAYLYLYFSTQFMKIPRYTYWDRDYNYSPQEEGARSHQKKVYAAFLKKKRSERLWKAKET